MLALYKENIDLYSKGIAKKQETGTNGAVLKVQAITKLSSNIQYEVVGRLSKEADFQPIIGIKESDGTYTTSITGTGVYAFDVTGYKEVTIKPQATIGDPKNIKVIGTIFREM